MDPWGSVQSEDSRAVTHNHSLEFEDKFVEEFDKNPEVNFEKLPDSVEYLKGLETKLSKLTAGRNKTENKAGRASLLQDLARAREDALVNFVTSSDNTNFDEDLDLSTNLAVNQLARRIVPEQALTVEEQVVLTKADQLEKEQEKDEDLGH